MKKVLLSIVMTLALGASVFAQSNGDSRAIAAAKNALKASCNNTGGNLQANVTENFNCNIFDGVGVNRTVNFYRTPNCPPNQPCIQVIELVGTVVVDCDYSIVSVSCGTPLTQ